MALALDPSHARHATRYDAALRERNRLLSGDTPPDPVWLDGVERHLTEHGSALAQSRARTIAAVAAALLCTGPLAAALGIPRWPPRAAPEALGGLAWVLVQLADIRNRLTHREAGDADDAAAVRARATTAGASIAALFG